MFKPLLESLDQRIVLDGRVLATWQPDPVTGCTVGLLATTTTTNDSLPVIDEAIDTIDNPDDINDSPDGPVVLDPITGLPITNNTSTTTSSGPMNGVVIVAVNTTVLAADFLKQFGVKPE